MMGYVGETTRLQTLLDEPAHSLEQQSYRARELRGAVVCADGWGAGFYVPDDRVPCLYRSTLPIWADSNRSHLARAVHTNCMLACVRSATDSLSVSMANTPPFSMGSLLLVHNGYVENFSSTIRRKLEQSLSDERYALISGRTDSEYLLAVIADEYSRRAEESPAPRLLGAVCRALDRVIELARSAQAKALLTLIVSDGHCLAAARAALGDTPPSLYFLPGANSLAPGSIVASEPLNGDADWRALEPGRVVVVCQDGTGEQALLQ